MMFGTVGDTNALLPKFGTLNDVDTAYGGVDLLGERFDG